MSFLYTILSGCYDILNYQFHIWGYTFSLMNFAVWSVLASFLLWLLFKIFD